jgi:uncharacterized repeat protein (TIGR03803 family)
MQRGKTTVIIVAMFVLAAVPHGWAGATSKVLHSFGVSRDDGTTPYGNPVLDTRGRLYGVTLTGGNVSCGTYGCGTVYQLVPGKGGKWKEKIIRNSTGKDGFPWGALAFDSGGNIYGTTQRATDYSEVFQLVPSSSGWVYNVLYTDFAGPGVLLDHAANVYGSIGPGDYIYYGAIAELSAGAGGWSYNDLYDFCSASGDCSNGFVLPAPPIWDGKGTMFGVTSEGGIGWGGKGNPPCWTNNGCGVIFEIKPKGDGTWSYHVLHRFASSKTDGQSPQGGLVMDSSGNFYGTTGVGGVHNNGTVFKLSSNQGHWKKTAIYDFPKSCSNGCGPVGNLAFDQAGNLYGANGGGNGSCSGGAYFCGMIYKLTPHKDGSWKYSSAYKFNGPDGFGPLGVTLDGKGHIFGATILGGKYNFGVAFEITP